MNTYSFGLDFVKPSRPGALPDGTHAKVFAGAGEILGNTHYLTPDCVCFQEFEEQINRLKGELDKILSSARGQFKTAESKRSMIP